MFARVVGLWERLYLLFVYSDWRKSFVHLLPEVPAPWFYDCLYIYIVGEVMNPITICCAMLISMRV